MRNRNIFLVMAMLSILAIGCCVVMAGPATVVGTYIKFEGYDIFSKVHIVSTAPEDITVHLDTIVESLTPQNNYELEITFTKTDSEYNNLVIYVDTPSVTHTITNIEVKHKKVICRDDVKSFTYKFDGEEKTGKDPSLVITK